MIFAKTLEVKQITLRFIQYKKIHSILQLNINTFIYFCIIKYFIFKMIILWIIQNI